MTPSLFEPKSDSQPSFTGIHNDLTAPTSLARELTPGGGYSPQARARAREGAPTRHDRITDRIEAMVREEFSDENQSVGGWLLDAFDRAHRNGWTAEIIATEP